jgi:hypothetical protein
MADEGTPLLVVPELANDRARAPESACCILYDLRHHLFLPFPPGWRSGIRRTGQWRLAKWQYGGISAVLPLGLACRSTGHGGQPGMHSVPRQQQRRRQQHSHRLFSVASMLGWHSGEIDGQWWQTWPVSAPMAHPNSVWLVLYIGLSPMFQTAEGHCRLLVAIAKGGL